MLLYCTLFPKHFYMQAFGTIRPRISLRFEECGLHLKDGRSILSGVTGYFGHSKVDIFHLTSPNPPSPPIPAPQFAISLTAGDLGVWSASCV